MIVILPGTPSNQGLGDFKRFRLGFFHFSNNNLAIRKDCALQIGMYDLKGLKSEDVDICFRVARHPHWAALRERGSCVKHKARKTFRGLLGQMWGWGYHVGYPYAKTGIKGIHLYWVDSRTHNVKYHLETRRFPFLVALFVTDFHLMHFFAILAALQIFLGYGMISSLSLAVSACFAWRYLRDEREAGLGLLETCALASVHYAANIAFTTATVLGALKHGILLVPCSIFRPKPADMCDKAVRSSSRQA